MRSQRREAWSKSVVGVGKSTSPRSVVASLVFTVPVGTSVFSI